MLANFEISMWLACFYQARAGFSWNKKIPYQAPPTQLGALKMYILDKRILGTQISMLFFYFFI